MSTDTIPQQPMSKRDVWLSIALAIARDGLPAPRTVDVRDDILAVKVDLDRSDAAAQEWAEYLGLARQPDVATTDGQQLILTWWGRRGGRSWTVWALIPRPAPAERGEVSDLDEQVIAAIGGQS